MISDGILDHPLINAYDRQAVIEATKITLPTLDAPDVKSLCTQFLHARSIKARADQLSFVGFLTFINSRNFATEYRSLEKIREGSFLKVRVSNLRIISFDTHDETIRTVNFLCVL